MVHVEDYLKNLFSVKSIEKPQDIIAYCTDRVNLIITANDDSIVLPKIVVHKQESRVYAAFKKLCSYADRVGRQISLEPSEYLGGILERLIPFCSRFGFVQSGKDMRGADCELV